MNIARTNETRKISELISLAMLSAMGELTQQYSNDYSRHINQIPTKVEEGDPVRSAERVPYSSSHQLNVAAA